jgi:uncharacterized protein (DUF362 family)/Pyruvate/2-oxoacid:ferredoxin oxidoreductase delta subunit
MNPRVALVRCRSYEPEAVEAAVRRTVDLLGGIGQFVRSGQRVLVKPNLLRPSLPQQAVVTHPAVVRAVIRLVQEAGARVLVADNPATPLLSQRAWQHAYQEMGLAAIAAETGAELSTRIVAQQRPHPEGLLVKQVDVSGFLAEADVVINLPKLKTHGMMRFTGAVKNLFGVVPGVTKAGYHAKLQTVDRFADMLLDLADFVHPVLSIMDAIVGMDGNGPGAGDPFAIGAILASPDLVAVDVAALALVGQDPASVPTVEAAVRRGRSSGRAQDLDLVGDPLDELRVDGFRMPRGGVRSVPGGVPAFVGRLGTRVMVARPFVTMRCIGCKQCIQGCPVQTIDLDQGRAHIRLDNCIRCYCCHEICPVKAIELHQPLVAQVLARLGL